jgi:XapX domain-containing protein
MTEVLLSLVTGAIVGIIFSAFKLPIPAPPVLAGITGIVGVFLGAKLYEQYIAQIISKIFGG